MKIINAAGKQEDYKIIENFPFTSETKRMGILLRHIESDRLLFYLKGADTVMMKKLPELQRGVLYEDCMALSKEGLRTLCKFFFILILI